MYDLAHMARTARRWWLPLALCAVVTFAALLGWSRSRPERFEASGVVVLPSRGALLERGLDPLDVDHALGPSDELVVLEVGRSSGFRAEAARRAGVERVPTRDQLFVRQVQGPPGSRIEAGRPVARVTALAGSARTARDLSRSAAELLAEEASREMEELAERVPAPSRAAVRRSGAIVGSHVEERRVGRSSRLLAATAAAFIATVLTLLVLVTLTVRSRPATQPPDADSGTTAPDDAP